ncbi:MAG TPA: Uma2 family endonuclease [Ktedonobacterales bacterium]|nr:Uma2 family endonuclease [Ktedonobacterales bacterium]
MAIADTNKTEELRRQLLALLSTPPQPELHMSYEEFLDWADEDTLAEWVDGKVIMTSPASVRHQLVAKLLQELVTTFANVHTLGLVIPPPFQMKLATSGREPDLLFITTEHHDRLKKARLEGPADLVVEVISPESFSRDRGEKYSEYEAGGVPEYWLIDPDREVAEFYQLDARGRYQLVAADAGDIYRSRVLPSFWLRVGWLWQDPLPEMEQALLEIDGDAYAAFLRERLRRAGL